jgi:hypothetical protein
VGKSLHLDEDIRDTASLQGCFGSKSTVKYAEALLGQITEMFAEAEDVSSRFKNRVATQDNSLVVHNPQTDLNPTMAKLHEKMR